MFHFFVKCFLLNIFKNDIYFKKGYYFIQCYDIDIFILY